MLGLGLGLTKGGGVFLSAASKAAKLIYNDYYSRVTADGGTVEGESCFERAVFLLGVRTTVDYVDEIFSRWTSDDGIVEAEGCFINSFFLINS
jgi:hypothetical protein